MLLIQLAQIRTNIISRVRRENILEQSGTEWGAAFTRLLQNSHEIHYKLLNSSSTVSGKTKYHYDSSWDRLRLLSNLTCHYLMNTHANFLINILVLLIRGN